MVIVFFTSATCPASARPSQFPPGAIHFCEIELHWQIALFKHGQGYPLSTLINKNLSVCPSISAPSAERDYKILSEDSKINIGESIP